MREYLESGLDACVSAQVLPRQTVVFMYMLLHSTPGLDGRTYWAGNRAIAEGALGRTYGQGVATDAAHDEAVKTALRRLRAAGLVEVLEPGKPGQPTTYALHVRRNRAR